MSKKVIVEVGALGLKVTTEGEIRDYIECLVILDAAMRGIHGEIGKSSQIIMPPGRS